MLTEDSFLKELLNCGYSKGESVLAGVSGGMDSMTLAHLFLAHKIPIALAHVNYGLRGEESEADEKFVADFAARADIPLYLHRVSEIEMAAEGGSVQLVARKIRYNYFENTARDNGFKHISVAHHADDNMETVLLNLLRGTGIAGLTGMDIRNGKIIRPLLHFTRQEIHAYARSKDIEWREDSSNLADNYTRNRLRHHLLPWLLQEIPQGYAGFDATLGNMHEAEKLLEASVQHWEKHCVKASGADLQISIEEVTKFRETILYLRFYLRRFGFSNAMLENLPEILQGESGKQIHSPSHRLLRDREKLILTPLQAHEILQKLLIEEIEKVEEFSDGKSAAEVDGDLLTLPLQLRTWKAGDKMIPLGMQGHRNVSDVLNELKLPAHEKEKKEIVVSGDEIVWVPGYRIADKFKVTDKTRRMLRLRLV